MVIDDEQPPVWWRCATLCMCMCVGFSCAGMTCQSRNSKLHSRVADYEWALNNGRNSGIQCSIVTKLQ